MVKEKKNMGQKYQILIKFLPYISIGKLPDGLPVKLNNLMTRFDIFVPSKSATMTLPPSRLTVT